MFRNLTFKTSLSKTQFRKFTFETSLLKYLWLLSEFIFFFNMHVFFLKVNYKKAVLTKKCFWRSHASPMSSQFHSLAGWLAGWLAALLIVWLFDLLAGCLGGCAAPPIARFSIWSFFIIEFKKEKVLNKKSLDSIWDSLGLHM